MSYISTIKIALILFPILAFVITIPYMIVNYRKYGSVNKLRTVIFYSFILYLLAAYSLVNLPLPDPATIHTTYTDKLNLVPFSFVKDFLTDSPFVLTDPSTWIDSMKYPSFYIPAFNVLMLVPFGIYMRYYFKCSLKKTILLSALLSLFFELTQLSGLYFIYPGLIVYATSMILFKIRRVAHSGTSLASLRFGFFLQETRLMRNLLRRLLRYRAPALCYRF